MYQGEEEQEEEGKCGKVGVGNDSIHVPCRLWCIFNLGFSFSTAKYGYVRWVLIYFLVYLLVQAGFSFTVRCVLTL